MYTVNPPAGQCYTQYNDQTALWWSFCSWYAFDVPYSATKVRTSVYVDDFAENGTGWQKTWSMNLN